MPSSPPPAATHSLHPPPASAPAPPSLLRSQPSQPPQSGPPQLPCASPGAPAIKNPGTSNPAAATHTAQPASHPPPQYAAPTHSPSCAIVSAVQAEGLVAEPPSSAGHPPPAAVHPQPNSQPSSQSVPPSKTGNENTAKPNTPKPQPTIKKKKIGNTTANPHPQPEPEPEPSRQVVATSFRDIDKEVRKLSLYNFAECHRLGKGIQANLKKAIFYHRKAVDMGYVRSIVKLGKMYESGQGLPRKDYTAAVSLYERAAKMKYAPAKEALALCYRHGRGGLRQNSEKTISLLRDAIKINGDDGHCDHNAYVHLGDCYRDGFGVKRDFNQAFESYRRAAKYSTVARVRIGDCFMVGAGREHDPVKAVQWFSMAEDDGEPEAFRPLATCYAQGMGTERSPQKAIHFLLKAIRISGDIEAMLIVAEAYQHGHGVPKDDAAAFKYWTMASNRGDAYATFVLAECYLHGVGVKRDAHHACEVLQAARDAGEPCAFVSLAECYFDGIGVERDVSKGMFLLKAATHFEKSPAAVNARMNLAKRYLTGQGVVSAMDAVRYLEEVCALNPSDGDAFHLLAVILLRGELPDLAKDVVRAINLLQKAVDLQHTPAMVLLAQCCRHGMGLPANKELAFTLFEGAAEYGDVRAQRELARCLLKADGCENADPERAVKLLETLANADDLANADAVSIRYLAELKLSGKFVKRDMHEAARLFGVAADLGDSIAMRWRGICFRDSIGVSKEPLRAFEMLSRAAEAGDDASNGLVGRCYEHGEGVDVDCVKAVSFYEKAVKSDSDYLPSLLRCYTKVNGDESVAAREAMVLCELYKDGERYIGLRHAYNYATGNGVEKDVRRAVAILRDALSFKFTSLGVCLLADCLTNVEFGEEGAREAVSLLEEASSNGFADGKVVLAKFLLQGIGIERDEARAVALLKEASQLECVKAAELLGDLYSRGYLRIEIRPSVPTFPSFSGTDTASELGGSSSGTGTGVVCAPRPAIAKKIKVCCDISVDLKMAASFYERAVKSSGYASYRLAKFLLHGTGGLEKDRARALSLLQQARRKGCVHAHILMARFYARGAHGLYADRKQAVSIYERFVHQLSGRTRGRAMFSYAAVLRDHGVTAGKFSSQVAAEKRVSGLLETAKRTGCTAAGNDLAVLIMRKNYGAKDDGQSDNSNTNNNSSGTGGGRNTSAEMIRSKQDLASGGGGGAMYTGDTTMKTEAGAGDEAAGDGNGSGSGRPGEHTTSDDGRVDEEISCGNAFQMFLEMGQQGEKRALTNAGICLEQGIGVIRDENAARVQYEKAVWLGDRVAMNNLAVMLIEENNASGGGGGARRTTSSTTPPLSATATPPATATPSATPTSATPFGNNNTDSHDGHTTANGGSEHEGPQQEEKEREDQPQTQPEPETQPQNKLSRAKELLETAFFKHRESHAVVNLGKLCEENDAAIAAASRVGAGGNGSNGSTTQQDADATVMDEDDLEAVAERCRVRRTCSGNQQAFTMYKQADELGCADGMFNMAACYEAEIGIERDERLAIKYYKKALSHGVQLAEQRLVMYKKDDD